MKVLVICDDFWHPGEIVARGLKPLEKEGYELDIVMHARDILTKEMIRGYDVIVNAKSNVFSPANSAPWFDAGLPTMVMPRDFRAYVEEGHGFIALHAGNCYSREKCPDMADLTGNDFIGHPAQCDVTYRAAGNHPVTRGVEAFTVRDEHYILDVFAADAEVFLTGTSDSEAGTQTAGYARRMGRGRFVCLSPGHNCHVLLHPQFRKLMANALDWCGGREREDEAD